MPVHVERLSRRLALGMDGISLDYMFSQWRLWRFGNPIWAEPAFFMEAERNPCADAGRLLQSLKSAASRPELCIAAATRSSVALSDCANCHWGLPIEAKQLCGSRYR